MQMSDLKTKMHQKTISAGLRPRRRWAAYSAPKLPSWI